MPYFATIGTEEIPDDMHVQHDDIKEYAELLGNCSDFIVGLGCGRAAYDQFKAQFNLVGSGGQSLPAEQEKNFRKRLLSGLTVRHFRHTTQQGMTIFAQTTKQGVRGLDPYFMIKIGRNWKRNLVSK